MHTIERLEKAIAEAVRQGLEVRMEPLGGSSGGLCEFGKRRWIFVDITASVSEQLHQVQSALRAVATARTNAGNELVRTKKVA